MNKLSGKVALITGAGAGIGAATARLFAEQGARLVLTDIDTDAVRALAEEIPGALAVALDVADESAWHATVARTLDAFGGLDILVNNAGIDRTVPMLDTSVAQFRAIFETNQLGVFLGMREAGTRMRRGGSIVNLSSLAGMVGIPGRIAYTASKYAVRGMTKVAALELASRGIRVNSVHPGAVNTAMLTTGVPALDPEAASASLNRIAMKRVAEPSEVAKLILFLAGDDASYSTGSEFIVDGGILAGPAP